MSDLVKDTLEGTQKALRREKAAGNAAMIDDAVSKMSENERAKVQTNARVVPVGSAAHPLDDHSSVDPCTHAAVRLSIVSVS